MDRFYTPKAVAEALIVAATIEPSIVADFAAGEGALLDAAEARWPKAQYLGVDINASAIAELRTRSSSISLHCADFTTGPAEIENYVRAIDLILLNPPFSCRGNRRFESKVGDIEVACSRALAFVCHALRYLSDSGELVCILPASCLTSVKDQQARLAIGAAYGVHIVEEPVRSTFDKCSVVVAKVRIDRNPLLGTAWKARAADQHNGPRPMYSVIVGRGSTPVHRIKEAALSVGTAFVHTSNLSNQTVRPSQMLSDREPDLSAEAAVLLPRVGRPNSGKVAIATGLPMVLSDCICWLRTLPAGHESELKVLILSRWNDVARLYTGSCAPYITVDRLAKFLESTGLTATVHLAKKRTFKKHEKPDDSSKIGDLTYQERATKSA